MCFNQIIQLHQNFSSTKLSELRQELSQNNNMIKHNDLAVFATGAFARFEANEYSGIDLYLIKLGKEKNEELIGANKDILDRCIINSISNIGLPPLCDEHVSLKVHNLDEISKYMFMHNDFYFSFLEIRMLFLLESAPIFNESLYENIGKEMISKYLFEFSKQSKATSLYFMINDILRYWKTVFLNYQYLGSFKKDLDDWNCILYLKNLKMEFSKKLASYSFILQVLVQIGSPSTEGIFKIIQMKPLDRLFLLGNENRETLALVNDIVEIYTEFLEFLNQPSEILYELIMDGDMRKPPFEIGQGIFSEKLFQLVLKISEKTQSDFMRMLI